MREYELYLPTTHNDGTPVPAARIEECKATLVKAFGGYTHLQHRTEGEWKMGGVTYRDEITLVRVLDDGGTHFDWPAFKRELEARLEQETILIVVRPVELVE